MAGTGLARSSTRSIVPVSIRSSRNQVVAASMSGRIPSTARGTRYGFMTRRRSRWAGPSTSAMPCVGMLRARGIPAMPSQVMPSDGSGRWVLEKVSPSRDTAATSAWPLTTQKPP